MKLRRTYFALIAAILTGCATVESVQYASDYEVCRLSILRPPLQDPAVIYEADRQIGVRGLNCALYSAQIRSAQQEGYAEMERGLSQIERASQGTTTNSSESSSSKISCFLRGEYTSGTLKNCRYDCMGSEAIQTIASTEMCPLGIRR
jgi:hypothetical protein